MQARIGQKHTAEYRADKPLCGTWAEIDGRPGGSSVFPQVPIPKVHAIIGLLGADEGIAPMDELLKATLPASITPSVLRHLPELDVSQPDKVQDLASLT